MRLPTVSVVMSNYNHARFLPVSLSSLAEQDPPPDEVVLIDDGSTDNSLEVIDGLVAKYPVIRLVRNDRNRGVLYSYNRGLRMARCDYVLCAAADDLWLPGFLAKSLRLLAEHPEAALCTTRCRVVDEDGADQGVLKGMDVSDEPAYLPAERVRALLSRYGHWMQGNTTVYRRSALLDEGGFLPELYSFTDNFASQVLALKHGACFIPEPLGVWRRMRNTYSARCWGDSKVVGLIIRNASDLMRNKYRDLFPPGYARDWEREAAFDQARIALGVSEGPGLARRLRGGLATLVLVARHRPALSVRRKLKMLVSGSARGLAR